MTDDKPITIEFENGSVIEGLPNVGKVIRSKIRIYSIEDESEEPEN